MTIDELCEAVVEDLDGRIASTRIVDRELVIQYECDDWRDLDRRLTFLLRCSDVAESSVQPGAAETLSWLDEHALLREYGVELGHLFFTSAPDNPHEVLGRLYQTHQAFYDCWRRLCEHLNDGRDVISLLRASDGLLLSGPVALLRECQRALDGRMRTNIVESRRSAGDYRVLLLDEHFVVCRRVRVEPVLGTVQRSDRDG